MKNYFIANGEVLNTNMSIEEMESRVQESLDENTSGMAQFRIKEISEKEVRFFFVRDFLFTGLGLIGFMMVYRVWKRRGGRTGYTAPEAGL